RECSLLLDAAGLVVADRDNGIEIDDVVAHERSGVYIVSAAGLRAALSNSIYVVRKQGNYYMRVDGEKLREERSRKGYSLGDLASMLSVSRRSIYMYEQEEVDISLNTALRLMDIFGEEVFKPIPILREKPEQRRIQRLPGRRVGSEPSETEKAVETIVRAGGEAVETKRIPPDVVARLRDDKMLIVIERKRERRLEKRVYEAAKVAMKVVAKVIAVTRRREYRSELEDYGVDVYTSIDEFISEVSIEEDRG
ncbi:MAG TPA: helix-turn-helix domain-containing protein, partial [Pyrodictium sp.]|nr:helix-turn-helix domain-containing protein [Pyrodictium sp.]